MNGILAQVIERMGDENLGGVTLKFVLAIFLAGLLGLERESRGRAAGLRTHILVCLGSTLLMIISDFIAREFAETHGNIFLDRGRIAAGIVTGVGFLGAGTIVNIGREPRGLTTAAMIWFAACLGVAIGSGYYFTAMISTLAALGVVRGLALFERLISTREHMLLIVELPGAVTPAEVERAIHQAGCIHSQFRRIHLDEANHQSTLEFQLDLREQDGYRHIVEGLRRAFPKAISIDLKR